MKSQIDDAGTRVTAIRDEVQDVLRRRLWIGPGQVQVHVDDGTATLTGAVGRRSTAGIATRLAAGVPGVSTVQDRIGYDFDDTRLLRSRFGGRHMFSAEPFHPAQR
ncbi:BON domain-containing protein [Actinoplanes sp. GCM10030250]|uniref:BON domain-containing protein n=1 Tax=Actinoplanes sp. GCM10030250 TaxID=3273376 RepID=UPI0036084059